MLDTLRGSKRDSGTGEMPDCQALDWLIQHRGESVSTGCIATATGLAPDVAQRALEQLETWGLVQRETPHETPCWRLISMTEIQRRARSVRANKMLRELEEWHARWRPMTTTIEDRYRRLRDAVRSAGDSQLDDLVEALDGCH